MGLSKAGENFSVSIAMPRSNGVGNSDTMVFNNAAIHEFTMNLSLNELPRGHVVAVADSTESFPATTGIYATMTFSDLNTDVKGPLTLKIYIANASVETVSENKLKYTFDWELGSFATLEKMTNWSFTGTSVSAMKECVKQCGGKAVSTITGTTDNMIWRFVNSNFEETMNYIVAHSSAPGDVLYWVFNENTQNFEISTFNTSKRTKKKNLMLYTQDSVVSTSTATYKPSNTDTRVYQYSSMLRLDNTANVREKMFPNLIIHTVTSDGDKEVGDCMGSCRDAVLQAAGVPPTPSSMRPDDGGNKNEDTTVTYGDQQMIMTTPQNTYKMYAVARATREAMMAQYSRLVNVTLSNHFGPPVGSCVHLLAASPFVAKGDSLPDVDYSARYIVLSKIIQKISSTSVGTLGVEKPTTTAEYQTILNMGTNFQFTTSGNNEFKLVSALANEIIASGDNGNAGRA